MRHSDIHTSRTFKVNGIVAEYNPFHNGHSYQLRDAKKQSGADYTIVAMSGNFMQRGTPAILDKYRRAEMALRNGADLVLELPALYSASSAEYFATGAVTLLDKLGVVDFLCFGSECGDLHTLQQIADILLEEPEGYTVFLQQYLRNGLSYPMARTSALVQYCPSLSPHQNVLSRANNILGIEYLKAIRRRESSMQPVTTVRGFSDYHDRMMGKYQSSALALRQAVYANNGDVQMLASQMPESAFAVLDDAFSDRHPMELNDFSALMHYKLLLEADKGYTAYLDVSEELSDRIRNHLYDFTNFRAFCDLLKTKNMTYSRISRCLMHILLNITVTDMEQYRAADPIQYARVLGFRRDAEELLGAIKENACIPLLTKLADAEQVLDETGYALFKKELLRNAVYESTAAIKAGSPMVSEYRSPLVII